MTRNVTLCKEMPLGRPLAVGAGNMTASAPLQSHSLRAMVLWDSTRLDKPIANPYPLKPRRTTALVNLSEGAFDPP